MRFASHRITLLMLCLLVGQVAVFGQIEDDEFRSGVIGHYSDTLGHSLARRDTTISLAPGNVLIDQRLAGTSLQVRWTGFLMSQAVGEYRLHVYGAGHFQIALDGESVLRAESNSPEWSVSEPLPLQFAFHPLEVTYDRKETAGGLQLFWSGPQFQLEPIGPQYLFHDPTHTPDASLERGEQIVRALRCATCHQIPGESPPTDAPSLTHVAGNMHFDWLVDWLSRETPSQEGALAADAAFHALEVRGGIDCDLLVCPIKIDQAKDCRQQEDGSCQRKRVVADHGLPRLSQGGSCRRIRIVWRRRPHENLHETPARVLRALAYRTGRIEPSTSDAGFSVFERRAARSGSAPGDAGQRTRTNRAASRHCGTDRNWSRTVRKHHCAACHGSAGVEGRVPQREFAANINWNESCAKQANERHPGYQLSDKDRLDVARFITETLKRPDATARISARQLLAEQNCLACHLRDDSPGLSTKLPAVAEAHPELAELLPAMTPPPLISVGDKLYEQSIRDAILRKSVHRDYLRVRMPKFNLSDEQLQTLVDYFVYSDRVPPQSDDQLPPATDPIALHTVGSRLVTTDGFGCTSCHQLGSVQPTKAPLNARGPNLTLLAKRIRREWFERFVRNPLRVIPRMEMPSVQVAIRGILNDDLDTQLAAVWDVLNTPDFEPPLSDPVRTVRHSGIADREERAVVITDVVRSGKQTYVKPLLIGLPNRNSFLFDFETAALVQWSVGDVAQERTEGKTWFWTAVGTPLLKTDLSSSELTVIEGSNQHQPRTVGQFVTEFDEVFHTERRGLGFRYRLRFDDATVKPVSVTQVFDVESYETGAVSRRIEVSGLAASSAIKLQLLSSSAADGAELTANEIQTRFGALAISQGLKIDTDFSVTAVADGQGQVNIDVLYRPLVAIDVFPTIAPVAPAPPPLVLDVVPGFETIRLPISNEFMPTAMDWRPSGDLIVASLKGQVWNLRDTDDDGLEDEAVPISDELAAPYGVAAYDEYVDVVSKYGLLRVYPDRMVTIASGWGHTTDYHDWVIGLPRDEAGNYYVALPCEQDKRAASAARYKGSVLKLSPREPTLDDPQLFAIEALTAGHRFPMGIARNRAGEMFVTDNQGNYNPFNELNHVVTGKRYGFINTIDRNADFKPPLTAPAIDIPHPWTRSVNGICFLDSPLSTKPLFGPFEGHLIGCEYDTRRLIRMSLQRVGDTYQGAAYPFSYDTPRTGDPLLGPLVCAVSPQGDLYVGGIRDSGWGGSNNIGEIVRLRPRFEQLPCGIAEVRATASGFILDFTAPIDPDKASQPGNYSVSSYTRVSTPAYGGEDQDRRQEQVAGVRVANAGQQVEIQIDDLRAGFVYELHLKNLAAGDSEFFPAEAHYTLRVIP